MTLKIWGCECSCRKWPPCPIVRKCCFCVPIRRGVTIFGYVNLVTSLLSLPFLIFLLVDHLSSNAPLPVNAMDPAVDLPITIAFLCSDVIITIVLLVGAHKKKKVLLQVYFYFGAGLQLLSLCLDLVYFDYSQYMENMLYLLFLSLNIYLLFLVYCTVRLIEECAEVQYVAYQDDRLR